MSEPTLGKPKEGWAKWVVVGIIVIVAIVAIGFVIVPTLTREPPDVRVTSTDLRTGLVGLDYTAWVDVSVHNYGGAGDAVVWAKVWQGSNEWTKSMEVHLDKGESKDLTFEFRGVGFWSLENIYGYAWVTAP